jgi:hypothetical protein
VRGLLGEARLAHAGVTRYEEQRTPSLPCRPKQAGEFVEVTAVADIRVIAEADHCSETCLLDNRLEYPFTFPN